MLLFITAIAVDFQMTVKNKFPAKVKKSQIFLDKSRKRIIIVLALKDKECSSLNNILFIGGYNYDY